MSESTTSRNQYFAAICVNILSLGVGASISWTSPYLAFLQSQGSPFGYPISASQASWVGSLLAVGALFGSFFFGWISEKIGRFYSLIVAGIPQVIWWIIIISSLNVNWLFLGRFLAGFSAGGSFTLIPLYIAEISQDKNRGSLGSFFILSTNLGMLLMYVTGRFFDYFTTPKVMLMLPISFFFLFSMFPETPIYLLRIEKIHEAERSLMFLRRFQARDILIEEVKYELQKMIRKVNSDAEHKRSSNFSGLRSSAARKGIFIGIVLISVNQLSGLFAFLNYTADIFIDAGSEFNPNTSAIIVGSLLFIGSLISLTLVDKFSRKSLYSMTTVGNIIGLMAIGIHSYLKTNDEDFTGFKFIPVISLSLVIFAASIGRLPLTYIIVAEIMPQNIRSLGVSICTTCNWILAFILLQFFSTIVEVLNFHNCMLLFCCSALFGMVFVIFFVPETKNRSFEEIENSLMRKKFQNLSINQEQSELEKL